MVTVTSSSNVLMAQCGIHHIAMYQKFVPVSAFPLGSPVTTTGGYYPMWVCAACEAERVVKRNNAGSN